MGNEAQEQDALVCRSHGLSIRSLNESERSIDVVASTDAVDSYGEIVAQNWRLDRYNQNPVVLFAHNSRELPVGRAENVRIENGGLCARFIFATADANPLAEQVWQSVRQKTLRGVSVGFKPNDVRYEKRDGKDVYVLDDNELFEISMTPVPANPEGLARMKQRAFELQSKAGTTPSRDEVTNMDLEKLKADLAAKSAELGTAQAAATEYAERINALELDVKAQTARADAADVALKAERERADKLDAEAIEADVVAVIAKKITPAQKDEFVEIRNAMGREKFAGFIGKFADLKLTEEVLPSENHNATKNSASERGGSPSKLLAKAHEKARVARGDA
jgi:HK97 family phage prohead protease